MEDQYELLKRKSEEKILGWGGEILAHLPLLDSLEDVSPMPAADVARRALVLCRFAAIGYGGPAEELTTGLKEYGLWDAASTRERTLLESGNFTEQNIIDFTWRTEAIQALAWTLGLVELDPHRYCDDDLASRRRTRTRSSRLPHSSPSTRSKSKPTCCTECIGVRAIGAEAGSLFRKTSRSVKASSASEDRR